MSKRCRAYSESKLGLKPADNRNAFYAGWDAAMRERLKAERDELLESIKAVIAAEQSEGEGAFGHVRKSPTREHRKQVAAAWQKLHETIAKMEGRP